MDSRLALWLNRRRPPTKSLAHRARSLPAVARRARVVLACAEGRHFKKVCLLARKAGGWQQDFLKVTLSDVLISSFQTAGSGQGV